MALLKNMSALEKKRLLEISKDPVKWAQAFLRSYNPATKQVEPWTARWYQVEMLRDQHVKKVYRCGRRIGKCLPGHTRIYDPQTGERVTVEELYKRGKVNLLTMTNDYKITPHFTNEILDNGIKEVFRVKTKTGRTIDATANHPLFTVKGWENIEDLNIGSKVALVGNLNYFGKYKMDSNKIKLLAYMIGDGNCTSKTIRFSTQSELIKKEMIDVANYFDCELVNYESSQSIDYNIVKKYDKQNRTVPNKVKLFLESQDVFGKNSHSKKIPTDIFKLNKKDTITFLSRIYATDGWSTSSNGKHQIGYCSVSRELISDIQHLLLKFGINSTIYKKNVKYKERINIAYQLLITNSNDVIKFSDSIGIFSKEKAVNETYKSAIKYNKYDQYLPKEILDIVESDRLSQGLYKRNLCKEENERVRYNCDIQKSKLKQYAEILKNDDLKAFADGEFIFDEITSIESIGDMQTYDLSVPITMNFVAEDFITHNTETMVVEMLHKIYTNRNFRVLMAAPYENQIRNMFMRLNELIAESPLLKQEVVKSTKSPYQIIFKNGSAILGFTTGDDASSIKVKIFKFYNWAQCA